MLTFALCASVIPNLPSPPWAEDRVEVVGGWWGGEAAAPMRVEAGEGPAVALGVTTAGEPGPRSIRLSSGASPNIWERG